MYIRKQRLLTPGPTPLYPPALHAMMRSDMHHRTEDFRKVYRACLADLKEVMGTSNDVLMFAASGTGAMDASVSNLFSKGDKVIVFKYKNKTRYRRFKGHRQVHTRLTIQDIRMP